MTDKTTDQPQKMFEVKGGLARLLAEENIYMRHDSTARTAYFDVRARLLVLPVWHNISEDLYDMLVVHEVGHALYTAEKAWMKAIDDLAVKHHGAKASDNAKDIIKQYLNVVEDARIDKLQKRKFPGTKRNYLLGYKELNESLDFFGLKNKDVNGLTLIDRLNVHFKSSGMVIKFTPAERAYIKRMENLETFQDVVDLADELYVITRDEMDKRREEREKNKGQRGQGSGEEEDEADQDENDEFEIEVDEDDLEEMMANAGDSDSGQGANVRIKVRPSNKEKDDKKEEKNGKSEEEKKDSPTAGDGAGEKDQKTPEEKTAPRSVTEDAAAAASSRIVENDASTVFREAKLPEVVTKYVVDKFDVVIPQILAGTRDVRPDTWTKHMENFNEWKKKENDTISFMIKEFEMRKAADAYSRIKTAKTGVIDMAKLPQYKFNDDLFRKVTVVPEGKSHGFVMLLDWSGSMHGNIANTVKQLLSLVMFCKRIGVPFDVYTFRSSAGDQDRANMRDMGPFGIWKDKLEGISFGSWKMRQVLSSQMNAPMFNNACRAMWFMGNAFSPACDPLCSTPLNQSIIALMTIVPEFQKKSKVQIVNTIILSDGASDTSGWNSYSGAFYRKNGPVRIHNVLKDPVTKKSYWIKETSSYEMTSVYLRILKDRTGCNLIGFHLQPSQRLSGLGYMFDPSILESADVQKQWKENKFFGVKKSSGYDEHYVLSTVQQKEEDMKITPGMSQKAMAKNFIKYSEKKKVNRALLTSFITRISDVNA